MGGSSYAEHFAEPFDRPKWLKIKARQLKTTEEEVGAAWDLRGEMSRTFGTSLHKAMECWFKYRHIGYGLPKHPFLQAAVSTFPDRDLPILSELMVSDIRRRMVGQIDGYMEKHGQILDYKSDASVEKNLTKHFNQMSFYAHILMAHDFEVQELVVWNYRDKWYKYGSKVLPLMGEFLLKGDK